MLGFSPTKVERAADSGLVPPFWLSTESVRIRKSALMVLNAHVAQIPLNREIAKIVDETAEEILWILEQNRDKAA